MKRFSKFVETEESLKDTKELIEEDLKGDATTEINGEVSFSSQLVKDIDLLLAIMNNLKTGALYTAVGTATSSKLVEYVKRIADKIEKNQKEIDKQYKKDLKECIDKLCNENGIAKFTSIEDLEEVLYILKDNTQYEPYVELATNGMISDLIKNLKEIKNDNEVYRNYRDSYPIIANGLETVVKRMEKQRPVIKHLGTDVMLSVFQGYLRDKIKSLVKADSALYRAAYTYAYGVAATKEAEEKGGFFTDARIEVDIVTRFLLKDTGLEDCIIDSFKSHELAGNRLVKNNSYDKLKNAANVLFDLDEEYQKLQNIKSRKDALLMNRRRDIPSMNSSDEERREYLEKFIIPENLNDDKWNERIIESSNLSQSLGTDGIMHLPQDKYEYALGDFADFISDYSSYVNSQDQFLSLLESFKNPDINIYLKNRMELEKRIAEIDNLLGSEITPKINELTSDIEKIVPKESGFISRVAAKLSNRGDLKDLEAQKAKLELQREQLINERKNKHDIELLTNGSELIDNFNIQLASYLDLFKMWNIKIDLDFILDYNIEELKNLYKNNIKELEEAYKKRIKIILDDLAKVTNSNPQNMYKLAKENGISLEKPSALVPRALKNFISFLNNCSAINCIADPSILKKATELCQAKVSIDEEDFELIFRETIKDMDEYILGELPEEETPVVSKEVEEPTQEFAADTDEDTDSLELEVPVVTPTPSDTMIGFKVISVDDLAAPTKDTAENSQITKIAQDVFAEYDAEMEEQARQAQSAAEDVKVDPEDDDYFNELLAILNGSKESESPVPQSALEPLDLPSQGERPFYDFDSDVASEDDEDVVLLPPSPAPTTEFEIPIVPDDGQGLKLTLNNPNQN